MGCGRDSDVDLSMPWPSFKVCFEGLTMLAYQESGSNKVTPVGSQSKSSVCVEGQTQDGPAVENTVQVAVLIHSVWSWHVVDGSQTLLGKGVMLLGLPDERRL